MPPVINLGYLFPPEKTPVIAIQDPRYPKIANAQHDRKVLELETILKKSGTFDQVLSLYSYSKNGQSGEVDVLAIGRNPEWYEVKYRFTRSNLVKAVLGFQKYRQAFPSFTGNAFYVSCDGILIDITNINTETIDRTTTQQTR